MRTAAYFAIVALIALAFTAAPGGDATLNVVLTLLTIAFCVVIALAGYRLFHRYRFELESLPERQRLVLYSSLGLGFLTLCATNRLIEAGGVGVIGWILLLALCAYGLYWVWTQYRAYG